MSPNPQQLVGRAISITRSIRPPQDPPLSISGLYKYFPAEYECYRLVPTMVCKWKVSKIYRDLFYFDMDSAHRAGVGIASNVGLPFILGLKNNKTASKSDLALLSIEGIE
jgi:hypothetical protein